MAKDKALSKVLDNYRLSYDARQPKETIWQELYEIYRAYVEDRKDDKSNLFIPYLFSIVETVVPRLTDTIFAQRPYLKPLPREAGDIENAEAMEILLDYQLDKIKFKRKASDWFKEACIYGTGFVKIIWKTDKKNVKKKVPIQLNAPLDIIKILLADIKNPDEIGMTEEILQEVISYDGPDIELVDIMDFFPDPYADSIENARFVVHRSRKPLKHVKEMIKQKIYKGNFKEIAKTTPPEQDDNYSVMNRQADMGQVNKPTSDKGMCEILEYWESDRVITVINREFVVRDEENPYNHKEIPFVDVVDTRIPKEIWGLGEIEPNKRLQHEMNTIRNQRVDIVSGSINNMFAYIEGVINPEDLVSRPNGLVPIKNQGRTINESLQQLGPQRISPAAWTEEDIIKKNIQETSGVTQYVQGIQPNGQATATEITSLQREANYRFKQKIMNMIDGIERVGQMMVALNQQFMTEEQFIRIAGDRAEKLQYQQPQQYGKEGFSFLSVDPEGITGQFDIRVASTALEPLADKQVKRQQLLEVFQVLLQQGMPSMELMKEILKTYDIPAIDKVVKELEMQQAQQQQLQQMEAMQKVQGQPPNPQQQVPQAGGMM